MTTQKGIQIALLLILVLLVGMVTWKLVLEPEPVYHGKPLSYWLNEYGDGNFVGIGAQMAKKEADEAVRHIGTNLVDGVFTKAWVKPSYNPGTSKMLSGA